MNSFSYSHFPLNCLWRYRFKFWSRFWQESSGSLFQHSWSSCQFGSVGCGGIGLCDVLVCAESKVSDPRHLSELRVSGFGCPQQILRNSAPGAQGLALYVRVGFCSFRQGKLESSCHESCVFRICIRIKNFYVYSFYRNPGHDGSLYDCLLDSMAPVQSDDDKALFVFVGDANAHHSEWLYFVSLTERHGRNALHFCNLSGCEQLVRCPTHLLITDSILWWRMSLT